MLGAFGRITPTLGLLMRQPQLGIMANKFFSRQKRSVLAAFWTVLALPTLADVTVTKTTDLSFGKLLAGGSGGTVWLSSSVEASRTATGVTLITQGAGANGSRAVFSVTGGPPNTLCTILLPVNDVVALGSHTMVIGNFISFTSVPDDPIGTITLNGSGAGTIYLGGTLHVADAQAAGTYANSLSVSVNCPP